MSYPTIRNNNSIFSAIRRTHSTMGGGFEEDINTKTLLELQDISSKVSALQTSHNELVRLLAPLFARSTEIELTVDAINEAAMSGNRPKL